MLGHATEQIGSDGGDDHDALGRGALDDRRHIGEADAACGHDLARRRSDDLDVSERTDDRRLARQTNGFATASVGADEPLALGEGVTSSETGGNQFFLREIGDIDHTH